MEYLGSPYVCIKHMTDPSIEPDTDPEHWQPLEPKDHVDDTWESKSYPVGSLVKYKNNLYLCKNEATVESPTDEVYWTKTKYRYKASWNPRVYKPGTVVKFKNYYYKY